MCFGTYFNTARLKPEVADGWGFEEAARNWRLVTARRADRLLRKGLRIDTDVRKHLAEERRLAKEIPDGLTGGWGIACRATQALVVVVGQNPYWMRLFSNSAGGFDDLHRGDYGFLWLAELATCAVLNAVRGRGLLLLGYCEWEEVSGAADSGHRLHSTKCQSLRYARILNYQAYRYYNLDLERGCISLGSEAGSDADPESLVAVDAAGRQMLAAAFASRRKGTTQVVLLAGKRAQRVFSEFFDVVASEQATHFVVRTVHPAARGMSIDLRNEAYLAIARTIERQLAGG